MANINEQSARRKGPSLRRLQVCCHRQVPGAPQNRAESETWGLCELEAHSSPTSPSLQSPANVAAPRAGGRMPALDACANRGPGAAAALPGSLCRARLAACGGQGHCPRWAPY